MAYVANAGKGGISAFSLDRQAGTLGERGVYLEDRGVAPLAMSPDRRFLYAAIRSEPAAIAAFAIDAGSGALRFLGEVAVPAIFHYLVVDATGRHLLAASYGGGTVVVMPLGREGMVQSEPSCVLRPGRNPHCVVLDSSNLFAFVPVLGSDIVAQFRFDANTGALAPGLPPFVAAAREAGPRHMVLSPDNRFAYVLMEMGGEVGVYGVCRESGSLAAIHSLPFLTPERALPKGAYPPPDQCERWGAEIRMTPDARFLYVSERTGSTISRFRADPVSGRLDLEEVVDTERQPRGFALDPLGEFLIVVGERSDHASVHRVDRRSGKLELTDRKPVGSGPTWVEMVLF